MARNWIIGLVCLASLAGCGKPDVTGEWELVNAKTGAAYGDVMTLNKGGTFHRTGFPALAGTYEWVDGKIAFKVLEVAGIKRSEAIKSTGGIIDLEAEIKKLEAQMVFDVVSEQGNLTMRQANSEERLVEIQFRKKKG